MAAPAESGEPTPRLNPFALPSDASFRFALLIVFVLATSVFVYIGLPLSLGAEPRALETLFWDCFRDAYGDISLADLREANNDFGGLSGIGDCMAPLVEESSDWVLLGVVALLAVAFAIYWAFPIWKIRRGRLVPLDPADAPEVVDCLQALCRETGLKRTPAFLWNPLNSAMGALAFGRLGRYQVALSGGLVTLFYSDREAFRAIVLHELAHLRNGDVDRTYFTVAVWWSFVAVALLPYGWRLLTQDWDLALPFSWRILALTLIVYLTRNAILRGREIHADLRASVWDGPKGGLERVLESLPSGGDQPWMRLLRMHPDPGERRRLLDDGDRLFHLGLWDAVAAGIGVALALPLLSGFIGVVAFTLLGTDPGAVADVGLLLPTITIGLPAILVAVLAVGAVSLSLWRMSLLALLRRDKPRNPGLAGLGLGIGLMLGSLLSLVPGLGYLDPGFGLTDAPTTISPSAWTAFMVAWAMLLLVSLYLFCRWIAAGATAWLEVALRAPSPRPAYLVGLLLTSLASAIWIATLVFVPMAVGFFLPLAQTTQEVEQVYALGLEVGFLNPFVILALIALWAFPLAAWFRRGRLAETTGSGWIYLDGVERQLRLRDEGRWRPLLALLVGLLSGAVFCVLLPTLAAEPPMQLARRFAALESEDLSQFVIIVTVAAVLQALGGAVAAAWVRRQGALHGLFAAFVAGSVMALGLLTVLALGGGTFSPSDAAVWSLAIIYAGAVATLPLALVAAGLAWAIRRLGRRQSKRPRR